MHSQKTTWCPMLHLYHVPIYSNHACYWESGCKSQAKTTNSEHATIILGRGVALHMLAIKFGFGGA